MIIVVPNKPIPSHLSYVKRRMKKLGAPKLRAVFYRKRCYALEGSHRVAAAQQLGLPIILEPLNKKYLNVHAKISHAHKNGEDCSCKTVYDVLCTLLDWDMAVAYNIETEFEVAKTMVVA